MSKKLHIHQIFHNIWEIWKVFKKDPLPEKADIKPQPPVEVKVATEEIKQEKL